MIAQNVGLVIMILINFNRSLTSLGVDEEKVKEHLTEYIEWIDQLENCRKYN